MIAYITFNLSVKVRNKSIKKINLKIKSKKYISID